MKIKLLIIMAVGAGLGFANAATVTGNTFDFSAAPDITGGVLLGGVAATSGQVNVNVGYFNSTYDLTAALAAPVINFTTMISNFNIVASGGVGNTSGTYGENFAGLYETPQGGLVGVNLTAAIGQILYTFFGTGASLAPDQNYGLVSSGQTVTADGFPPTSYVLSLVPTLDNVKVGEFVASANFAASTLGIVDPVARPAINIVPEPSAALIGAIGALGLLRRRRN